MSVVLRIGGKHLDPDLVISRTSLPVTHVFRRGEPRLPRSKPRGAKHQISGLNLQITPKDGLQGRASDLVRKAVKVISKHRQELRRIVRMRGVESAVLDIGIPKLDVAGQFERIPAAFLLELGKMGIDLEISIYYAFA